MLQGLRQGQGLRQRVHKSEQRLQQGTRLRLRCRRNLRQLAPSPKAGSQNQPETKVATIETQSLQRREEQTVEKGLDLCRAGGVDEECPALEPGVHRQRRQAGRKRGRGAMLCLP